MFAAAATRTVLAAVAVVALIAISIAGSAGGAADTSPPDKPILTLGQVTQNSAVLSWQQGVDNVGVDHYDVWLGSTVVTQTTSLSYSYTGLTCGSDYILGLEAVDAAGNKSNLRHARWRVRTHACSTSLPSIPPGDASPPAKPILTLGQVTQNSAVLSWQQGVDNVGVDHYDVWLGSTVVTQTTSLSHSYTGLTCGTDYILGLEAVDAAGNKSSISQARWPIRTHACPTSPGSSTPDRLGPTAPTNLRVTAATPTRVDIAWSPSQDNVGVTGYDVYEGAVTTSVAGTSHIVRSLGCGMSESVAVSAFDAAGNRSPRAALTVSTAPCVDTQLPSTPLGFRQTATTADAVMLAWTPSSDNVGVVSYGVYRDLTRVASPAEPTTALTGLSCGSTYVFSVDAADASGNRSTLGTAYVQTSACVAKPSPPTPVPGSGSDTSPPAKPILTLGQVTQNSAVLSWQQGVDNVGVDHYDVWLGSTVVTQTTSLSYSYTGLTCGTDYILGLEAVDAAGNTSSISQARWPIRTLACGASTSNPPSGDTSRPSPPQALAVSASAPTSVSLSWSAATDDVGVVGYAVDRNGTNVLTATGLTASVTGLTCGTAYSFAVRARDAAGNQSPDASVVGSTTACNDAQPPSAPTNVVATTRTSTSIALSWAASTDNVGVTGYALYRGGTQVATSGVTNAILSGLVCNANYTLAVDAVDAAGNRSARTTVMVATTSCPDTTPPAPPSALSASSVTQTGSTLVWNASTDNVGVTGYDVSRNGTNVATVTSTTSNQTGLACGTFYSFGVVARDAAGNRSSQTSIQVPTAACSVPAPPSPPPSTSGTVLFDGGFDTGNESQWDYFHRYVTDRFRVNTGADGVSPRQGSHMARVEVRPNEPASWDANMNVTLASKNPIPGASGVGDDSYTGFSLYLPNGFSYVPNTLANNIVEWHGSSNVLQAPIHFGINGYNAQYHIDLHTNPAGGWNPTFEMDFGPITTGRWVDFVIRTKWATNSSGIVEVWKDGVKVVSSGARQTYPSSGQSNVYLVAGNYRANYSRTAVLYLDAFKVGTSYQSVAP